MQKNPKAMKTDPYFKNKITPFIEEFFPSTYHEIREIDLTDKTDDPGNTVLQIAFIPMEEDEDEIPKELSAFQYGSFVSQLQDAFDSAGDHHEEITVLSQNNEYIIIYNANK